MTDTLLLPLGATVSDGATHFHVWAPNAKAVHLTGDFNDWNKTDTPLEASEDGHWKLSTDKLGNGGAYQYVITAENGDQLMRNDPRARRVTNSVGNSLVYADDFDWEDDAFTMPAWNELVIYELHVGTFNVKQKGKPGTFASAIERLDTLQRLGINCIEVMPVCEFAGDFSWGYNPAHPFAVEEAYGGPDGFKTFVKEAHARGMAVILDVVYNHFGPSDLALWQFDGWSENDKGGHLLLQRLEIRHPLGRYPPGLRPRWGARLHPRQRPDVAGGIPLRRPANGHDPLHAARGRRRKPRRGTGGRIQPAEVDQRDGTRKVSPQTDHRRRPARQQLRYRRPDPRRTGLREPVGRRLRSHPCGKT